ncbi:MAG: YraN family protein [Candidatus Dadabacteria bacterium]|nr:MAG: YraN family protein [Candidatus Dadabacteria bacterium]
MERMLFLFQRTATKFFYRHPLRKVLKMGGYLLRGGKVSKKWLKKKLIGKAGEVIARYWLTWRGYSIITVNWRCQRGEIDIIAVKGRILHIIEVKTRTSNAEKLWPAKDAITPSKYKTLMALTHLYAESNYAFLRRFYLKGAQIDLVTVVITFKVPNFLEVKMYEKV